jgi:hypothetical protein
MIGKNALKFYKQKRAALLKGHLLFPDRGNLMKIWIIIPLCVSFETARFYKDLQIHLILKESFF